jgi:hypothetical protein
MYSTGIQRQRNCGVNNTEFAQYFLKSEFLKVLNALTWVSNTEVCILIENSMC